MSHFGGSVALKALVWKYLGFWRFWMLQLFAHSYFIHYINGYSVYSNEMV